MKKCPYCDKQIPLVGAKCPHCDADLHNPTNNKFLPLKINGDNVYVGLWDRLWAGFFDGIFFGLFYMGVAWISSFDRNIFIVGINVAALLIILYSVYFLVYYGGTIGKLMMGIRVVKPNGDRISWNQAWKRLLPDIFFQAIRMIITTIMLLSIDHSVWLEANLFMDKLTLMDNDNLIDVLIEWLHGIWMIILLIVLIIDKRNRTVHDFIAGTAVVKKEYRK